MTSLFLVAVCVLRVGFALASAAYEISPGSSLVAC